MKWKSFRKVSCMTILTLTAAAALTAIVLNLKKIAKMLSFPLRMSRMITLRIQTLRSAVMLMAIIPTFARSNKEKSGLQTASRTFCQPGRRGTLKISTSTCHLPTSAQASTLRMMTMRLRMQLPHSSFMLRQKALPWMLKSFSTSSDYNNSRRSSTTRCASTLCLRCFAALPWMQSLSLHRRSISGRQFPMRVCQCLTSFGLSPPTSRRIPMRQRGSL
mmetsp:Transcript_124933/g.221343  ORF Transcript_124933/g.221343 Transcript_124933/m.221343 type:complete len:218 (-) Transcript_124933:404-1057(-)